MNNLRRKYRLSFFAGIVWFVLIDSAVLMEWSIPRLPWLVVFLMSLAAYSLYLSGPWVGIPKRLSALIAGVSLASFMTVLFLKGWIG